MSFDLENFIGLQDAEITSAERTALVRLQENKDFDILCEVLGRYLTGRTRNLASEPRSEDWQTGSFIRLQGGFEFFKRMLKLVRDSEAPPKPKKK